MTTEKKTVNTITQILIRRHGKQGRLGVARWKLLAWIGLLFVGLLWASLTGVVGAAETASVVYYHYDGLGSVTHLTDSSGNVVEKYAYDVFGTPTILSANSQLLTASVVGNRFMFTGREYLAEVGIYDYRNRMYSPDLGRFLQTDPIGFEAGDVNLYRYCGNSAVNETDPNGTVSGRAGLGGAIIGAVIGFAHEHQKYGTRLECYDWGNIALSAVIGAIGGATAEEVMGGLAALTSAITAHGPWVAATPITASVVAVANGPLGAAVRSAAQSAPKLLGTARDNLLNAAQNSRLRGAINELHRLVAKLGSGSSMDAIRIEGSHVTKVLERRTQLTRILNEESLNTTDRQIVKHLLIDMQDALSKHIGTR